MEKNKIIKVTKKRMKIDSIVIDYLENELPIKEIAKKNKTNIAFVYRVLHQRNIEIVRKKVIPYQSIAQDYSNGMNIKELMQKYETSNTNVYRALKYYNISIRPKEIELTEHRKSILQRIKNGETQANIARELGITRQRVNQIYKESIEREQFMERENG